VSALDLDRTNNNNNVNGIKTGADLISPKAKGLNGELGK
jgi:hypothetical protein